MEYVSVDARFLFYNGKGRFTVEYTYGLAKWFIFVDREDTNAVYIKEDRKIKFDKVNRDTAMAVLDEYLETV